MLKAFRKKFKKGKAPKESKNETIEGKKDVKKLMVKLIKHQVRMLIGTNRLQRGNLCALCINPQNITSFFKDRKLKLNKNDVKRFLDYMETELVKLLEITLLIREKIKSLFEKLEKASFYKIMKDNTLSYIDSVQPCRDADNT